MQLLTAQQFKYKDVLQDSEKHYLLMPNEVKQVKDYLELFPDKTLKDAFSWLTGYYRNVDDVRLEVIYYNNPLQ